MLTAYDSYSSLTNNQTNSININNDNGHYQQQLYAEHSLDDALPIQQPTPQQQQQISLSTAMSPPSQIRNNFENVRCNMTMVDDEDDETEDDDVHVSTKVRRCFGNTMCMPQNLLCFKVWLLC